MSVLSMSLSGLRLCNVHAHTVRLAEQFIRVDVISFTHWPIIGSAHFFHMCVCASTYFILFCIRTVAQAVSLLLFHHYHRLLFLFFSFFFRYLVCLSIHLVHVIFHISRCLNSVNRVDVDCKAIPMFHFVRALLTDLLTVSRLMRWAFHVTWTALRHALLHQRQPKLNYCPPNNKHFLFTVAGAADILLCILLCVFWMGQVCMQTRARALALCVVFCAIHQ